MFGEAEWEGIARLKMERDAMVAFIGAMLLKQGVTEMEIDVGDYFRDTSFDGVDFRFAPFSPVISAALLNHPRRPKPAVPPDWVQELGLRGEE